jgi:peptidoglycan hydrolase CwlO-like protein
MRKAIRSFTRSRRLRLRRADEIHPWAVKPRRSCRLSALRLRRSPAALLLAALSACLVTSAAPPAHAASSAQLQQQIASGQQRINGLSGQVAAAGRKVRSLNATIAGLQARLSPLQHDLDAKRAELLSLRSQLSTAQTRLTRLEAAQKHAERVLSTQLIGAYENVRPDIVTVVLESKGFNDLLNRLDFINKVGKQDARIVGRVKTARAAVAAQAVRLGRLNQRQQQLTAQAANVRNRVAAIEEQVVQQRIVAAKQQEAVAGQLASAKSDVASLGRRLARIEAQQAQSLPGAGPTLPVGSGSSSAGGFEFPMPKADASPPGTWSPDDGVDISAPGGTPELAVCSGTIVLHGIGGFGPSAPVLHCDSPIDGYSYVYYGHAGPGNWVPIGAHVSQGQVISEVGYGIVGISTGPHLEIGFADSSGSPIGPSSAGTMMALLQAAYSA